MRVRIIFDLRNRGAVLPFYHQHLFSRFIKDLLADTSFGVDDNLFYNFSGLKGQTRVSRKGLHYCSRKVTLVLSALRIEVIDGLLESLFSRGNVQIGELDLVPEAVEQELMPEQREMTKYICISPLVVSSPRFHRDTKEFIVPSMDKFSDLLYDSTLTRMEESGHYTDVEMAEFYKFQLVPDRRYLEKIQQEEKKFARIYPLEGQGSEVEVRGYTFPFVLYAHPQVQNFICNCGLGEYTDYGFGMLDFAHSDPTQRTQPYGKYGVIEENKK